MVHLLLIVVVEGELIILQVELTELEELDEEQQEQIQLQ